MEDDMLDSVGGAAAQLKIRKKATGVRPWLLLDSTGQAQIIEANKHAIMHRTGLSARDLRILLSYPSTVLSRERAIVINLEHVKAIITAQDVLLLNSEDESVTPFVDLLKGHILRHPHATSMEERVDGDATFDRRDGPKLLPFEFVALEACLEAACGSLDKEARTLEQEAHSALDKLTSSKISTSNMEHVCQIKSRLVAITGRVQKVRDRLEQLLHDDGDMAEMYLTHKLKQQLDDSSSSSFVNEEDVMDADDIEELQMLLEDYFLLIDGILHKLSTLREYVDDTQDYINIKLDDEQNYFLEMGVKLAIANLAMSAFVVVARVLWMNTHIDLFNDSNTALSEAGNRKCLWTVGGGTIGTIFLYFIAIVYLCGAREKGFWSK